MTAVLNFTLYFCLLLYVGWGMCQCAYRGQRTRTGRSGFLLLPPRVSWTLDSGCQGWRQIPLLTEPFYWSSISEFLHEIYSKAAKGTEAKGTYKGSSLGRAFCSSSLLPHRHLNSSGKSERPRRQVGCCGADTLACCELNIVFSR